MPRKQSMKTTLYCGAMRASGPASFAELITTKSSPTQAVSITAGVTANAPSGLITTFSAGTLVTGGTAQFRVTNSKVSPSSTILLQPWTPAAGVVGAELAAVTRGSFDIKLRNHDLVTPVTGSVKIGFTVL